MAFPFMQMPFDLRTQILFHCLVTNYPIAIASCAKKCYVGGLFLSEKPAFFNILVTSHQLWNEGLQVFLTYHCFVFGDFISAHGQFKASPRWRPEYGLIDGRICEHQRSTICGCNDFDIHCNLGPYQYPDAGQVLPLWLDQKYLGRIKHIIIILHQGELETYHNEPQDNYNLIQAFLFLERVNQMQAKLESLFIMTEHSTREEPSDHSTSPFNPHLRELGSGRHLIPILRSLLKRCSRMHVHFSTFNHVDNNMMNVPSGPRLNSETAMSARSYLSTIDLGGDIHDWKLSSGISFSRLMPDGQRFDVSDDGRYLLCFDTAEIYAVQFLEYEELRRYIVTHRANLLRADRCATIKVSSIEETPGLSTKSLLRWMIDQPDLHCTI